MPHVEDKDETVRRTLRRRHFTYNWNDIVRLIKLDVFKSQIGIYRPNRDDIDVRYPDNVAFESITASFDLPDEPAAKDKRDGEETA